MTMPGRNIDRLTGGNGTGTNESNDTAQQRFNAIINMVTGRWRSVAETLSERGIDSKKIVVNLQTEEEQLLESELARRRAEWELGRESFKQERELTEQFQKEETERLRLAAIEAGNIDQLYYVIRRPGQGCIGMWLTTNEAQQRGLDPAQGSTIYYDPNPTGRPLNGRPTGGRFFQREVPLLPALLSSTPLIAGIVVAGLWYWWRYR